MRSGCKNGELHVLAEFRNERMIASKEIKKGLCYTYDPDPDR
jgi:hypothetical protein